MITTLSRYKAVIENRNGAGVVVATYKKDQIPNHFVYRAKDGDTFQSLSSRYLGAPNFYWKIAEINPQVHFPDTIPAGTLIRIPR